MHETLKHQLQLKVAGFVAFVILTAAGPAFGQDPCRVNFGHAPVDLSVSVRKFDSAKEEEAVAETRSCHRSYPYAPAVFGALQGTASDLRGYFEARNRLIDELTPSQAKQAAQFTEQCMREAQFGNGSAAAKNYIARQTALADTEPGTIRGLVAREWLDRLKKQSFEESVLFGDYQYLNAVERTRDLVTLAKEARRIVRRRGLRPKHHEPDELEQNSYFTVGGLNNYLLLKCYQSELSAFGATASLSNLSPLLYSKELQVTDKYFQFGLKTAYLNECSAEVARLATVDPYTRSTRLLDMPQVRGVFRSGSDRYVTYEGKDPVTAKVDFDGNCSIVDGSEAARAFRTVTLETLRTESSPSGHLFSIVPSGGGYEVWMPHGQIQLSKAEYAKILSGSPLPPGHPLSAAITSFGTEPVVLYTHALMEKPNRLQKVGHDFAFGLQSSYPNATVVRDPWSSDTRRRLDNLNQFKVARAGSVEVHIADESFAVAEQRSLLNFEQSLTRRGVVFHHVQSGVRVQVRIDLGPHPVVVVSGHSDKNLSRFVRMLGEANVFRDNYVVFNTCQTEITHELLGAINAEYGARAAFAHRGKLSTTKVGRFVSNIVGDSDSGLSSEIFVRRIAEAARLSDLVGTWVVCEELGEDFE